MLEKGSDKSEDVSLTESTDLTDGSTADSLDSRESTPSVEVKTKPTKVYDGEAVDLPKMEPVSGLSHLAKNRPKRHKTHAARRPIAKSEAIIADGDHSMDTAAMDDFFASKPVTKTRSAQENSKNNQMNKQNSVDKPERKKPEKKGWSFGGDKIGKFFKKSPTHTAKTPEPAKALSTEKEPEPSFNRGEPTRRSKENDLDKEKSTRQVDEEKEKDEAKEAVRPAPRVARPPPPGMALGPGGGAALMAELKKKRESKLNQKSPEVKEGSSTGVRYLQGTMTLMPPTKESAELPKKPLPVTRTSSPGAGQDEKDSGRSSLGLSKPRPAPRPPPKPRKSGGLVPGSPTTATTGTPSTGTPTKASTGTPSTGTPTKASTGTPSTGTPSKATTGTPSTGSSTKATTGTPSTGSSTKATTGTPSTGSPAPSSSTPTSSKTHPAAPPPKPEAVDEKEGSGIASPKSSTATREGKSDDGKVSDSASDGSKKRLSVKERTALLDQNRNEQPQEGDSPSTPKSSTLPRDSTGERLGELRRPLSHPGKSDRDSVSPSILRSSKSTEEHLEGSKEPPNGSADDDESVTVYV